jgi:hypothetical protein
LMVGIVSKLNMDYRCITLIHKVGLVTT